MENSKYTKAIASEHDTTNCSRRDFLKRSGAVLAGGALLSSALKPGAYASPRKIRIGVVGGSFGASFQWHEHPDCIVKAVSDLRPERRKHLADTYKCSNAYDSLEELVKNKKIDAVAIFTEGPNHVKHTIEAMKHGKHVISAVPACYGSVEEAELLLDAVRKYGLTYMMAETSCYEGVTMSARDFYNKGHMGEIFYCESEYLHDGLDVLYFEDERGYNAEGRGKRTWRYGMAPMHYPTHCTAHLISLTGERLTEVMCVGWGDDTPYLKDNVYHNPFHNETAMFKTDRGHNFRARVWWKAPTPDGVRATWHGTKMSLYAPPCNGMEALIFRTSNQQGTDDAGFPIAMPKNEVYQQKEWYKADLLPKPLQHPTGHENSHGFITHEFIDSLIHERRPAIDIYESLAYTVPGIVAHESALKGGESLKIPQFDPPRTQPSTKK